MCSAGGKENIVPSDTSPEQRGAVSAPRIAWYARSGPPRQSSKLGAGYGSALRTVLCEG